MPTFFIVFLCIAVISSFLLTGKIRSILEKRAIFDQPNDRSSHTIPTPRGGGLAVMSVLTVIGILSLFWFPEIPLKTATALALASALAVVSWRDDVRPLSPLLRLLAQMLAVAVGLAILPSSAVFQGFLPAWLDHLIVFFLWVWFINLFNFMDGIDGITGIETLCICAGLCLLAYATNDWEAAWMPLLIAATTLGFLFHNWHPARIFLGDVGSIPLGFLLGWLLLTAAAHGYWIEALILPSYYLTDATLTLLHRLFRGEKIWRAHREHFYQKAAHAIKRHDVVSLVVLATNLLLIASTSAATFFHAPLTALVCAVLVVFGGMRTLHRLTTGTTPVSPEKVC